MNDRLPLCLAICALALASGTLAAQDRPQDFNLPPGSTPTPSVQGPADERAGVQIGPRAIPTPTPTSRPVQTPAPSPAAFATATPLPTPPPVVRAGEAARPAARATSAPPVNASTPRQTTPPPAAEGAPAALPGFAPAPIATPSVATPPPAEGAPQSWLALWWPWVTGLLTALLAGILGGWLCARRRAAQFVQVIERPIIAPSEVDRPLAIQPMAPAISLEIVQLMRSVMMLTLTYRVTIANRADQALREVRVAADLISSSRRLPAQQQIATPATQLPPAGRFERIGPHQSAVVSGTLQLPLNAVEVFRQGRLPLCAPLLRLRVEIDGIEPALRTWLIGIGSAQAAGRVHPLPLSGPPGGYDNVRARELASSAA